MTAFLGPHAAFILASYAAALAIIGALSVWIVAAHGQAKRRLAALEAEKGARR